MFHVDMSNTMGTRTVYAKDDSPFIPERFSREYTKRYCIG